MRPTFVFNLVMLGLNGLCALALWSPVNAAVTVLLSICVAFDVFTGEWRKSP